MSGTGGDGWGNLQCDMHMVAARLGHGWDQVDHLSCPDCMDRLGRYYSHLIGGKEGSCTLSVCMTINKLKLTITCLLKLMSRHGQSHEVVLEPDP